MRTLIFDQLKSSFIRAESWQLSIISPAAIIHYPHLTDMSPDTTKDDAVTDSMVVHAQGQGIGESLIFDWSLIFFGISRFFPPVLILHGMNFKILRIRVPLIY